MYEVSDIVVSRDTSDELRGSLTSAAIYGPIAFLGSSEGDVAVCGIVDCNFYSRRMEVLGAPDGGDEGGLNDS